MKTKYKVVISVVLIIGAVFYRNMGHGDITPLQEVNVYEINGNYSVTQIRYL